MTNKYFPRIARAHRWLESQGWTVRKMECRNVYVAEHPTHAAFSFSLLERPIPAGCVGVLRQVRYQVKRSLSLGATS